MNVASMMADTFKTVWIAVGINFIESVGGLRGVRLLLLLYVSVRRRQQVVVVVGVVLWISPYKSAAILVVVSVV